MATKVIDTTARGVSSRSGGGIELYLKRIFALMFGAVGLTALATYLTIWGGGWMYLINPATGGMSVLYYILLFGGLGLAIWAQARVFSMKPTNAILLLALYSAIIGVTMTPLIVSALAVNPSSILMAFIISSVMFACMAMFGYKTVKDLSFMGTFLFIGMIGLILVGIISMFWPALMGGAFGTIVCLVGVLIFALFTAYDMNKLKHAYAVVSGETQKNQLAVLGALHLYISFVAMFQNVLDLLNRE